MSAYEAFTGVDLDWTMSLTSVWRDVPYDVPELHAKTLDGVLRSFDRLAADEAGDNPLGELVVGPAGAGKTHLLGALRREVLARGGNFILADLTDVRDFWETALQGAVTSLTRRLPTGSTQLEGILDALLARFGEGPLKGLSAAQLAEIRPPALSNRVDALVRSVAAGTDRHLAARHEAVLRALTLLGSAEQRVLSLGEAWLSGLDVREEDMLVHELPGGEHRAKDRLAGIAWAAQLRGPTVVAVDQLDAIVSEARAAAAPDAPGGAGSIFAQTISGLMGLRDVLPRALIVVGCLDVNWGYIQEAALSSARDRFRAPRKLTDRDGASLARLIERRLAPSYARAGFTPPYPTYPFHPRCFEGLELQPRRLLQRAEAHRQRIEELGRVEEIYDLGAGPAKTPEVSGDALARLDEAHESLRARVDPQAKLRGADPELDRLLETACRALEREQALPEHLDVALDLDFGRAGRTEPLHARLRVIDHADGDRERHLSMRFIQQEHHIAFQTRLKKALTESGVGEGLDFRRLIIFRSTPLPGGKKTGELVASLQERQGSLHAPGEDEIRTLAALLRWFEDPPPGLDAWLAARRPVSRLPVFAAHLDFLFGAPAGASTPPVDWAAPGPEAAPAAASAAPRNEAAPPVASSAPAPEAAATSGSEAPAAATGPEAVSGGASVSPPPSVEGSAARPPGASAPASGEAAPAATAPASPAPSPSRPASPVDGPVVLGHALSGLGEGAPSTVTLGELARHVAILCAAGSGKTVLLRRLVEEAALRGVPALVLDVANDLTRLREPWPTPPEGFSEAEQALADRFFATTETQIWTPGWESGQPVSADPLPDFGPLLDSPDELRQARELAFELLAADLDLGRRSASTQVRRALLSAAIEAYSRQGGQGLDDLLRVLDEPGPLADGYQRGAQEVAKLADGLRAAIQTNPLLRSGGRKLDFDALFGRGAERTRISVLNLSGLPSLPAQQAFVGRVLTLLFPYAKQRPARAGELAGLVVIDEAKDFAPSQGSVASSAPLRRAAAQLRKYGYGLVVATQEPKSIDNRVVSNSGTQIFGRALSPAAQQAMREMMSQLGGGPSAVGTLKPGTFFASVPGHPQPTKIRARWCLGHHGAAPTPEEVRDWAAADRARS